MASPTLERPEKNPIEKIATSVYPSFALLAGMQLDLFTPLKDGPMSAEQIAETIGVGSTKLKPLLYALVIAGLLNVEKDYFSNRWATSSNTGVQNDKYTKGGLNEQKTIKRIS